MQILIGAGKIVSGSIKFKKQELVNSGKSVMKTIRGNKNSIFFQDPKTSLNQTYINGKQLKEVILLLIDLCKER